MQPDTIRLYYDETGAIEITPEALLVTGKPGFDLYQQVHDQLRTMERSIQWYLGDLLLACEAHYGDMVEQLMDLTGLGYDALRHARYVASRFPPKDRVPELSFAHHRVVASLPAPQRAEVLREAVDEDWSVMRTKTAAQEKKAGKADWKPGPTLKETLDKRRAIWAERIADLESKGKPNTAAAVRRCLDELTSDLASYRLE